MLDQIRENPIDVSAAMSGGIMTEVNEAGKLFPGDNCENLLRAAEETAGIGFWAWDILNGSVRWSDGLYRIYGLERSDFDAAKATYEECIERLYPENRQEMQQMIDELLKQPGERKYDRRILRENGDTRIIECTIKVTTGADGVPLGLLGICEDVTQWRNAQETLTQQQKELTTYYDLVTHDVTNCSMSMAALIDRVLTEKDGKLTEVQQNLIKRSRRQVAQMGRLAENAKVMAAVNRGKLALRPKAQSISKSLEGAREFVRATYFDKEIPINFDIRSELNKVRVPMFEHLIINLFDNAVKYSGDRNSPYIDVEVCDGADDKEVSIIVRGGTPPETTDLHNIFRQGFKGADSRGSGMGLAVVRQLVESAGGTVAASRAGGSGAGDFEVQMKVPAVP